MRRSLIVATSSVLLLAAGCGSAGSGDEPATTSTAVVAPDGPSTTTSSLSSAEPGFPRVVTDDRGPVTIKARPERIAALSATHVEMLFAIGAADRVIAGDLFSNHPAVTESIEKLDSFNLSVEAVIALDPDLVVLTFDPGGAVDALSAVEIPVLLLGTAADLGEAYGQIMTLGEAVDLEANAAELVATMRAGIEAARSRADGSGVGVTYYHETDPFSYYTPSSRTFIGQLYELLGMENIADAAPDEFGDGYPQLSAELIVESDPDLIMLASVSLGESAATVAARPGWDAMGAVRAGRIIELDSDVASRWGPRVVELLDAIVEGLATLGQR